MDVVVLQHIACEPPGEYESVLRERGASLHRVELDEGEALPALTGFDAIVAMGGPMSVNDDAELPWLTPRSGDRRAVRAGVPYFGACLGVQLLAASLGARVYAGPAPEVGVLPVALTPRAPPTRSSPASRRPSRRSSGTAIRSTCPRARCCSPSSPAFPNQAFRYGRAAYGVQFHLEVCRRWRVEWALVPEYAGYADRVLGEGGMRAPPGRVRRRRGGDARGRPGHFRALGGASVPVAR